MQTVTVSRQNSFLNSGVSLYVYCDNKQVGKIKNGQSCQFEIEDGQHTIEIGHRNSDDSHVTADSKTFIAIGKDIHINISVSFTGFKISSIE